MRFTDLTGMRFGKLVVLSREGTQNGKSTWRLRCDCGTETTVATCGNLRSGRYVSCGCARARHGHATDGQSPTYKTWVAMRERCYRDTIEGYAAYGGSGVTVCDRWNASFEAFLADMGKRPPGKTLDRFPNRDGNYEPTNCRWATPREQALNRGTTILTEDLVQEIHGRREHGESAKSIAQRIARLTGCKEATVASVLSGRTWNGTKNGARSS